MFVSSKTPNIHFFQNSLQLNSITLINNTKYIVVYNYTISLNIYHALFFIIIMVNKKCREIVENVNKKHIFYKE